MTRVTLTDIQVAEMRGKYAAGARQLDLALEYGINQNTVSSLVTGRVRTAAGGPITKARTRKLLPEDVLSIRHALAEGARHLEITERYNISQQMVSNIAIGRAYSDVGGPLQGRARPRAKPLTLAQVEEIKTRLELGERRNEIAAALGVSPWTIDSVVRGATTGVGDGYRNFAKADIERMRDMYEQGSTQTEIARVFDADQQMVSLIVRGEMYASYGGPIAGARKRRLTTDQVTRIREAFAAGTGHEELGDRYGTTSAIIRQVVSGATYSQMPGPTFELDRDGQAMHAT